MAPQADFQKLGVNLLREGAACLFTHDKDYQMETAWAHIGALVKQANSTGTKLNTLHNKKDLCSKNITFVSKITLNNKYAK